MSEADKVSDAPRLTDKDVIRESISKMMNEKAAGPSGVVSEIVREAGIDINTDLVNQIIGERVIPAERELSATVNCYKGKGDSFGRGNYIGLKSTN